MINLLSWVGRYIAEVIVLFNSVVRIESNQGKGQFLVCC